MKLYPKWLAIKHLGGDKAAERLWELLHRSGFKDTNDADSKTWHKLTSLAKEVRP